MASLLLCPRAECYRSALGTAPNYPSEAAFCGYPPRQGPFPQSNAGAAAVRACHQSLHRSRIFSSCFSGAVLSGTSWTGCAPILARSPLRPPSGALPVSSAPTSTSRSQRGADTTPSCKRITLASRTAERSFLELVRHRHHPRLPPALRRLLSLFRYPAHANARAFCVDPIDIHLCTLHPQPSSTKRLWPVPSAGCLDHRPRSAFPGTQQLTKRRLEYSDSVAPML